ncbi:MAG: methyltransferase domain-containing protein [Rubripirellula sp.]|nr:methyltransferase domain-containing protein [Rubripirellula sp.]
MKLLNVGCGRRFHPDWTNIDLVASSPEVREYDLRKGLPFPDGSFDAVYHSHVLEHLDPTSAEEMLRECVRVLKPEGVLRIVVPDLEGIAREYLRTLESAASDRDNPAAVFSHQWMTRELLDQMCRQKLGGEMGQLMRTSHEAEQAYIYSRIGQELGGNGSVGRKTIWRRVKQLTLSLRKRIALTAVSVIEGSSGRMAYREARFRQSGEIHRWMYDRVSLTQLVQCLGLESARVCSASESKIPGFSSYGLDSDSNGARKPDSLFFESVKSTAACRQTNFPQSNLRSAA